MDDVNMLLHLIVVHCELRLLYIFRGLWNVPFISSCYLVNGTLLRKYDRSKLTFAHDFMDADMAFCNSLRKLDVFMYVSNRVDFGHLIDPESYDITRADPDMYQIFDNEEDWEARYIHSDYKNNFNPENKPIQVPFSPLQIHQLQVLTYEISSLVPTFTGSRS